MSNIISLKGAIGLGWLQFGDQVRGPALGFEVFQFWGSLKNRAFNLQLVTSPAVHRHLLGLRRRGRVWRRRSRRPERRGPPGQEPKEREPSKVKTRPTDCGGAHHCKPEQVEQGHSLTNHGSGQEPLGRPLSSTKGSFSTSMHSIATPSSTPRGKKADVRVTARRVWVGFW